VTDDITHKLSTEGADPLLFAGVNDANLQELQRTLGVRVSFRGDSLGLTGSTEQVDRATAVVQGLLDLARMGESVSPEDVYRLVAEGPPADGRCRPETAASRFGASPADRAEEPGAAGLSPGHHGGRHRRRIGPAGTGKTYLAVAKAVEALARKRVKRIILARPRWRLVNRWAFCRATCRRKWIRISGRCMTRWRT